MRHRSDCRGCNRNNCCICICIYRLDSACCTAVVSGNEPWTTLMLETVWLLVSQFVAVSAVRFEGGRVRGWWLEGKWEGFAGDEGKLSAGSTQGPQAARSSCHHFRPWVFNPFAAMDFYSCMHCDNLFQCCTRQTWNTSHAQQAWVSRNDDERYSSCTQAKQWKMTRRK